MSCRFYKVMPNAYEKEGGVVYSPDVNVCPHVYDGETVCIDKEFLYELKDGIFCPYFLGPWGSRLVDEDLRALLEEYAEKEYVEFLPVMIHSEQYGDRQYYIVHFTKIYDVIDKENTVYGPAGNIIKLRVDYNKVKDLHVFNSQPIISDINISAKVYKEIKKRKLGLGTSFGHIGFYIPAYKAVFSKDKYLKYFKEFEKKDINWHRKWICITILFCIGAIIMTIIGIGCMSMVGRLS